MERYHPQTNTARPSSPGQSLRTGRQSPYGAMVLAAHDAPAFDCLLAAISNWLFLAGFVVFPGAFTSLSHAALLNESQAGRALQDIMRRSTSLLAVGIVCCVAGAAGIIWVAWKFKRNYVWLVDRIFL